MVNSAGLALDASRACPPAVTYPDETVNQRMRLGRGAQGDEREVNDQMGRDGLSGAG